jgi:hypothetical protein
VDVPRKALVLAQVPLHDFRVRAIFVFRNELGDIVDLKVVLDAWDQVSGAG